MNPGHVQPMIEHAAGTPAATAWLVALSVASPVVLAVLLRWLFSKIQSDGKTIREQQEAAAQARHNELRSGLADLHRRIDEIAAVQAEHAQRIAKAEGQLSVLVPRRGQSGEVVPHG